MHSCRCNLLDARRNSYKIHVCVTPKVAAKVDILSHFVGKYHNLQMSKILLTITEFCVYARFRNFLNYILLFFAYFAYNFKIDNI